MIRNYFVIAWRNLLKNKISSFINISGLAAGIAVVMLIGLWIWDELSFDKYHQNYNRIAQVMQSQTFNGVVTTDKGNDIPVGTTLRKNFGDNFKYVVMSSWSMNSLVAFGDKKINIQGNYMEADAPYMLTLKMIAGSREGLKNPSSVLLSQSLAKKLFGNDDAVGKIVKINVDANAKVTGVYEDLPQNTSFKDVAFIAPFNDLTSWVAGNENNWYNNSFQLFVQLADNADMAKVSAKIKDIKLSNIDAATAKREHPQMVLQPMSRWHLYAEFKNGVSVGGAIKYVWMFAIIGMFVLLLACINFMNLSTARSEKRAKEVGIRKAIGSMRTQLISQFFSESLLVAMLAFILSIVLVALTLPFFNEVSGKQIAMPFYNIYFWLAGIAFSIITGLIAGTYPALYLSSFNPVKVLKGTFKAGRFAAMPRKVLVVVQFTVSIILIISTITVFRQVQFAKSRPAGYNSQGLIYVVMQTYNYHNKLNSIRNELIQSGAITDMSESSSPVTENDQTDNSLDWAGRDPQASTKFNTVGITTEFGKTVGWQFLDGRDFSNQFATDSNAVVINETAVKYIGFKKPVGEMIKWGGKPYRVIGVIKDMVMESPYSLAKQTVFKLDTTIGGILNVKLSANMTTSAALAKVSAVCKKYSPDEGFDYHFADEDYARKFADEERIGKLASFFAVLAIFISCLGLFGMASFVAEQRIKEIGVRKVLGASVFSLWQLISKEFVMLVLISLLIAVPTAYYFMHNWLQNYEYRTALSWWIFAAAGSGALLITLLTVSFQAIKAAVANPVKSLRSE